MSQVKHYITRVVLISWTKCKVEVFLWLLGGFQFFDVMPVDGQLNKHCVTNDPLGFFRAED